MLQVTLLDFASGDVQIKTGDDRPLRFTSDAALPAELGVLPPATPVELRRGYVAGVHRTTLGAWLSAPNGRWGW